MKTVNVSPEEMNARLVRSKDMNSYQTQLQASNGIPAAVMEKLAAKKVFPILVPEGFQGRNAGAPLKIQKNLIVALAECPPGDGPGLHSHIQTTENFFCVSGRFEISWGDAGENSLVMDTNDFLSVPKGVCRTFKNIGSETARMLAIIQLTDEEQSDPSAFAPSVGEEVAAEYGAPVLEKLRGIGIRFNAGVED